MIVLWNNIFFLFYENLTFSALRPPLNLEVPRKFHVNISFQYLPFVTPLQPCLPYLHPAYTYPCLVLLMLVLCSTDTLLTTLTHTHTHTLTHTYKQALIIPLFTSSIRQFRVYGSVRITLQLSLLLILIH